MRKRLLAIIATLAMVVAMMPSMVFGADKNPCNDNPCEHEAAIGTAHYDSIQSAVDAADKGATIKILKNITLTSGITIESDDEITLDLNGKEISYNSTKGAADQLIDNLGKLIINDSSADGTGKLTFKAEPAAVGAIPGYASNTVNNRGELIVNGGTLENTTAGTAAYVVDNNSTIASVSLTVNGGKLIHTQSSYSGAVRLYANSTTRTNTVNINGGEIIGRRAVWIQLPSSTQDVKLAELNITNGTITSTDASRDLAVYVFSNGDSFSGTKINISGGTIDGNIELKDSIATGENSANIPANDALAAFSITGGTFKGSINNATASNNGAGVNVGKPISGGTFEVQPNETYLVDGVEWDKATGKVIDPNATTTTPPEKSPNTGDNTAAPFAVAGLVLAAMAAAVVARRRYN